MTSTSVVARGPRASWRSGWTALVVTSIAQALLVSVVGMVIWTIVPLAFGWESSVVLSDSMRPRIVTGDVVVSRPVGADRLRLGQVVLVDDPDHAGRLRLHRYVDAGPAGQLVLQGDANAHPDSSTVWPSAVHGVGTLRAPWIGQPYVWLANGNHAGLALTVLGAVILTAIMTVYRSPDDDGSDPSQRKRPGGPGSSHRTRTGGLSQLGALLIVVTVTLAMTTGPQPTAAAFSARTSNAANTFTAAPYFTCRAAVLTLDPYLYYALDETAGSSYADSSGHGHTGTRRGGSLTSSPERACPRDGGYSAGFAGAGYLTAAGTINNPLTFSEQAWFKTSTTTGGVLIGFGTGTGPASILGDRDVYLTNSGRLTFAVAPAGVLSITSPLAYNDGRWHQVVVTLEPLGGTVMYVDGQAVAADPGINTALNLIGSWRVGRDDLTGLPNPPTSGAYTGLLDDVAVYSRALTATEVAELYAAST